MVIYFDFVESSLFNFLICICCYLIWGKKNIIITIHQNVSILVHTTPLRNNLRIMYTSSQIIGKPDNLKVCRCKKTRRPTPQANMARNTLPLFLLTYLFSRKCLLFHLFFLSDTNTINKGKSYEIIKKFY